MKWIAFIVLLCAMGPLMRTMFGEGELAHRKRRRGKGELAQLEGALAERDAVIEDLERRLGELESRLDFTERLLTQQASADKRTLAIGG